MDHFQESSNIIEKCRSFNNIILGFNQKVTARLKKFHDLLCLTMYQLSDHFSEIFLKRNKLNYGQRLVRINDPKVAQRMKTLNPNKC